jgi:hypothetical protein
LSDHRVARPWIRRNAGAIEQANRPAEPRPDHGGAAWALGSRQRAVGHRNLPEVMLELRSQWPVKPVHHVVDFWRRLLGKPDVMLSPVKASL